ncbi:hypothetical protein I553_3633 [Mycobacterium xenopi 4042]|uniref:Uncharacterized protein n=1 Tax=Mycobacterium xenopi 4042 TaxID=1299334 RepID=X7ZDJ1_MYCXE|nr:hypothetical protein I553_3633 [Mycobacterium xenopi 4042]
MFLASEGCRYLTGTHCSSTAEATSTASRGHPTSTRTNAVAYRCGSPRR